MNDPNGMFVDAEGIWHLYYQYDPTDVVAGNQHWGHATSQDLYHWINQPIALFPPEERVYVFSGSAVIDVNNTSGFFPSQNNGVVAIFTLARYNEDGSAGPETQGIAYSLDAGYSFQYYDGNPIIDSTSSQFRDPKVLWYGDHWVMAIAYAAEFTIGFYTSPDLKTWTHASNFSHPGPAGAQYECPNLVQMPIRDSADSDVTGQAWVLAISINPEAPLGGSATEYYTGTFNGTHFTSFEDVAPWTDFAKDNYAAQYFYGLGPGADAVNIGWASNWQYTSSVPTGDLEGWRSAMTLPRRNFLTNAADGTWVMVNQIYGLDTVLDRRLSAASWSGDDVISVDYSTVESNAVFVDVNVTGLNSLTLSASSALNISFASPATGETLTSSFNFGGDHTFYVDRGGISGFSSPDFTASFNVTDIWNPDSGAWRLQVVVDRTLYEAFLDNGLHAGTVSFFPTKPLTTVVLSSRDMPPETSISIAVWALKSAWKPFEDAGGIVVGNVTTTKRQIPGATIEL
ncbi:hypothetical protein GQ53DRAFT_740219 [Thozetella sp. PMI_491]|nr:hypothetical protein GQ53DRAFT_740219 [Thozetella sp. PMI_491]